MNYASVLFVGFASIALIWYLVWGRKHFKGPQMLQVAEGGENHVVPVSSLEGRVTETTSEDSTSRKKKELL